MKKTFKLVSIALMSVLMLTSLFFANVMFARAQAPASFVATDGASVLVGDTASETGIRFAVTISKADLETLKTANLGKTITFGAVIGRAGEELTKENGLTSQDAVTDAELHEINSTTYEYSVGLVYNEETVLNALIESGKVTGAEDANFAKYLDAMYADELMVRPYYTVDGTTEYGVASEVRSMLHIANAELVTNPLVPEFFAEKYIKEQVEGGEVAVNFKGEIIGEVDGAVVTFTEGDSAEIIARANKKLSEETLARVKEYNDSFNLWGFTKDRKVIKYTANYDTFAGLETEALEGQVYLSKTKSPVRTSAAYNFTNVEFANESAKVYFEKAGEIVSMQPTLAQYNGKEVVKDGKIDTTLIDVADGEAFELKFYVDGKVYKATNVKMYDGIFVNTPASRIAFVDLLSSKGYGLDTEEGAWKDWYGDIVTGTYLILEDIYFETNEIISNQSNEGRCIVFSATLDGLGHALHNVTLDPREEHSVIFGSIGANAVIKNLAINGTRFGETYTTNRARLFMRAEAENSLTLENFYFYSKFDAYTTYWAGIIWDATGLKMTTKNVVIDLDFQGAIDGNRGAFNYMGAMDATSQAENTYLISSLNAFREGAANVPTDFKVYADKEAMIAANNDYTSFDLSMWRIMEDGVPCFRSVLGTICVLENAEGEVVENLTAKTAGTTFTIKVVDGYDKEIPVTLNAENENVVISGNTITLNGENTVYKTTLVVKTADGKVLASYPIIVDTREPELVEDKLTIVKTDTEVDFSNTVLADKEIIAITFNATDLYIDGVFNGALLKGTKADKSVLDGNLIVETTDGLYAFNNVTIYDKMFYNTKESREDFVKTFSNNAEAKAREAGAYALAENLEFDTTNPLEIFVNPSADCRVFNDILDGYGYAITNTMIPTTDHSTVFGDWGENAVIKNIAFNNFYLASVTEDNVLITRKPTRGLLFSENATADSLLTLDNVYLYVEYEERESFSSTLVWGTATAVVNANNVFIYAVDNVADNDIGDYHKTIYLQETLTAINTYVVNPAPRDTSTGWTGKYATIEEMKAANLDLTAFEDSNIWKVVDGVPYFKSIYVGCKVENAEGEAVEGLIAKTAGTTFTIKVVDGYDKEIPVTLNAENENVVISGNTITLNGENTAYKTTLVVKTADGKVLASYQIIVDTREPELVEGKLIVVKNETSIDFSQTAIDGEEVIAISYNDADLYEGGVFNGTTLKAKEGDRTVLDGNLIVETTDGLYAFNNVTIYDKMFYNTKESREDFVKTFSNNAESKAREAGAYALAENLEFDTTNPLEIFVNPSADCRVFNDILDGYGYVITNTMIPTTDHSTVFGDWGEKAVIKNIAFNNFYLASVTEDSVSITRKPTRGLLFSENETTESVLTLDNVYLYVEYEERENYSSTLVWGSATGKIKINNVFIHVVDNVADNDIGDFHKTVFTATPTEATNAYVVNPGPRDTTTGFTGKYATIEEMKAANVDLTAFEDSNIWKVVDGVPCFRSLYIGCVLENAEGEVVENLTAKTAGTTFTIKVVDGYDKEIPVTLNAENENVVISGNTITLNGENTVYKTTLVVKTADGKVLASYQIIVDTREPELIEDKLTIVKTDTEVDFSNTVLADKEIIAITFNATDLYIDGVFNGALLKGTKADKSVLDGSLMVETAEGLYAFNNVTIYDKMFYNTKESREDFVKTFSNNAESKAREAGAYALAENIVFDTTNPLEIFVNLEADCRVFNDMLDGQGYAMTDIMIAANGFTSVFGDWGTSAVIKNIAFNNFCIASVSGESVSITRQATRGLLFYDADSTESALTLDNVYLYVEYEVGSSYSATIAFGSATNGSISSNNVFIYIVDRTENGNIGTYHSSVYTGTVSRPATNSYVVNPAEKDNGPIGTRYMSIEDMKAANLDLKAFTDTTMWKVVEGVLVWNSLQA